MKSSKQVHFINIRLFNRIFYKTDFIHLFEIFFGCYDQNTMFSVRSGACYSIDKRDQNNSCNDTFFKIVVCLIIISGLKTCKTSKTGVVKTRKVKGVAGNKSKVILYNKHFGNCRT